MPLIRLALFVTCVVIFSAQAQEQTQIPLTNWPTPLQWLPPQVIHDKLTEDSVAFDQLVERPAMANGEEDRPIPPTRRAPISGPLSLVGVTPCRVVDTRFGSGFFGSFGPPAIAGGTVRTVPVPQSGCGIPSTAVAYSLNVTVVPIGTLAYLTLYPAGSTQPNVSTLNAFQGQIVANAAIVPSGASGSVNVFVSNTTEVIIDINGYFAASGSGAPFSAGYTGSTTVQPGMTTRWQPNSRSHDRANLVTTGASWRFTAPAEGLYLVVASYDLPTSFSGLLTSRIRQHYGSQTISPSIVTENDPSGTNTAVIFAEIGDQVFVEFSHNTAFAQTVTGFITIVYLGAMQ
jgi:hypothetical protein